MIAKALQILYEVYIDQWLSLGM